MTVGVVTAIGPAHEAIVAERLGSATGLRLVRRCADVADLVAVCSAGRADVAVVSPDFAGIDGGVVAAVHAAGAGVVGIFDPDDPVEQQQLRQWGVGALLPIAAPASDLGAAALASVRDAETVREPRPQSLEAELAAVADRADQPRSGGNPFLDADTGPGVAPGLVVTVWGTPGAPGRTLVAVNLATEAARLGVPTLLVDADTWAASIAQHLALLDEAPGIAAATRLADSGHLDQRALAATAPEIGNGLRVLTGLPRADRWPEVRGDAIAAVIEQARLFARLTVLDVAAPVEQDEELSYDTAAPSRNGVTIAALRAATTVLAVGAADPVGLQRLVRGLAEIRPLCAAPPHVVANKVRQGAVGSGPESRVREALERFAGVRSLTTVPDDRAACDGALLAGRVLAEQTPGSPARRAIAALAAEVTGVSAATRRGWLAGRR